MRLKVVDWMIIAWLLSTLAILAIVMLNAEQRERETPAEKQSVKKWTLITALVVVAGLIAMLLWSK